MVKVEDVILDLMECQGQVSHDSAIIGYFVSIPVFADSGFVILLPLTKALSKEAKITLAGSASALALGLAVTHVLVPPTPGPIAAAGILEANLGLTEEENARLVKEIEEYLRRKD